MDIAAPTTGGGMADVKRGALREVTTRPTYDGKGKVTGHIVSAHHERAETKKGENHWDYPKPIESTHASEQEAADAVREHLKANTEKQGKGSDKPMSMREAIGSA